MKIPFVGGSNPSRSGNMSAQKCLNLIPETDADKSIIALYGRPGFDEFAYLGAQPIRTNGTYVVDDKIFAVMGSGFFEVLGNGTFSQKGTLLTSSGPVSMADNGTQLMLVDGPYGYIYNLSTGSFDRITDEDFPGADVVTFGGGYFVFNVPGTGQFMITALYDGTAVDALDIATAERDPDKILTLIFDHGQLWIFGEYTTEVWANTGAADFPFERIDGAVIEKGIAAKWSLTKQDNALCSLARDKHGKGYAVRSEGYAAKVISTRALESRWATYGTISDAYSISLVWEGHPLWILTFPTGNESWAYDASTGLWHEWGSYGLGRFRAGSYANLFGRHFIGDCLDGDIYELKSGVYDDNGDPIVRVRRAQHIHAGMKPLFFHALVVDMETGVGNSNYTSRSFMSYPAGGTFLANGTIRAGGDLALGGPVNPQAMLRWSDDGGHTWSDEHWASIGQKGQYGKQIIWNRLGYTPNSRIFELKITDPVKVVIVDAYAETTAGR